jgi:hypothetical protein
MTAEIDLRLKIVTATHCALVSHARAHGLDKFEVARLVLDAWAAKQIHGARMLASCLRAKGEAGAAEGIARAAQGIAGQSGAELEWEGE